MRVVDCRGPSISANHLDVSPIFGVDHHIALTATQTPAFFTPVFKCCVLGWQPDGFGIACDLDSGIREATGSYD